MNEQVFHERIFEAAAQPALERHARFTQLHDEILKDYQSALGAITSETALRQIQTDGEPRTVLQVVGHIMEWDRFSILSAADMLIGLEHPRLVTNIDGYIEQDGRTVTFDTIEAFNEYQAKKHASWTWPAMQMAAVEAATTLHTLFTNPTLLNVDKLERTKPHHKELLNGQMIPDITMGWTLWILVLEHAGVEHAKELGMPW
jgi:hypothetical protein